MKKISISFFLLVLASNVYGAQGSYSQDPSYSQRSNQSYYNENPDRSSGQTYRRDDSASAAAADSKYPQDRARTEADRQLNAKIRNKITGWFTDKYKNIALMTSNGTVTLTGSVSDNEDLTNLLQEIRKIDGVRMVTADVVIDSNKQGAYSDKQGGYSDKQGGYSDRQGTYSDRQGAYSDKSANKYPQDRAATEPDRQINQKIRDKITGWFTDKYKNVNLSTSNGNVMITGFVDNDDDMNTLIIEIRKIGGVRNVNNNTQVRR